MREEMLITSWRSLVQAAISGGEACAIPRKDGGSADENAIPPGVSCRAGPGDKYK